MPSGSSERTREEGQSRRPSPNQRSEDRLYAGWDALEGATRGMPTKPRDKLRTTMIVGQNDRLVDSIGYDGGYWLAHPPIRATSRSLSCVSSCTFRSDTAQNRMPAAAQLTTL